MKIEPCPFCGSTDLDTSLRMYVSCRTCDTYGPSDNGRTPSEELWNERTQQPHPKIPTTEVEVWVDATREEVLGLSDSGGEAQFKVGNATFHWGDMDCWPSIDRLMMLKDLRSPNTKWRIKRELRLVDWKVAARAMIEGAQARRWQESGPGVEVGYYPDEGKFTHDNGSICFAGDPQYEALWDGWEVRWPEGVEVPEWWVV